MTSPLALWLPRLSHARVLVLGHPVLDRYLYGVTHRISREAPVLIVRQESEALFLGGAGNTAANLAGLGVRARLVGPVGDDEEGEAMAALCREQGIWAEGLIRGTAPATITKTRILAGGVHTTRQQMLRIDREPEEGPSENAKATLRRAALEAFEDVDAVLVSDYGHEGFAELWTQLAREARARQLLVVVDSRHHLLRFKGVSAITPNQPEAEAALGREFKSRAQAETAGTELRDRLGLEAALLTRGREGMLVAARGSPPAHLEAIGGEAVDVTGAGDTVAATFASAWAAGADALTAARLANLAASIVVQKTGTAPIARAELAARIREDLAA